MAILRRDTSLMSDLLHVVISDLFGNTMLAYAHVTVCFGGNRLGENLNFGLAFLVRFDLDEEE